MSALWALACKHSSRFGFTVLRHSAFRAVRPVSLAEHSEYGASGVECQLFDDAGEWLE